MNSPMEAQCERFSAFLSGYDGSFVEGVHLSAAGSRDSLEVRVMGELDRPPLTILLESVHALVLQKPVDLDGAFVDAFTVQFLPKGDRPWPTDCQSLLKRHSGLPDLYRVRLVGPVYLDAAAAIMTVSVGI